MRCCIVSLILVFWLLYCSVVRCVCCMCRCWVVLGYFCFCFGLSVCVVSLVMKIGKFVCCVWYSNWRNGMGNDLLLMFVGEMLYMLGVCVFYWLMCSVMLIVDLYLGKVDLFWCVGIGLFSGGMGDDFVCLIYLL